MTPQQTKETPSTLANPFTSTKGAKGTTVVAVVLALDSLGVVLRWSLVNDCVCAHDAHGFSINLSGKHMPTQSYQNYLRSGCTDAFLGVGFGAMEIENAALLPKE